MSIEILKFYTPTCAPCRMVTKLLEKLIETKKDIIVTPIDATEDIEKVDEYNVCSTPTLIFLKDGTEYKRTLGMLTLKELEEIVDL